MDTASLRARLQSLQESLKLIQQLITRLSKLSSDNEDDEENTRTDLADEIHQNLKEQEDDFELIQQDAEDLTNSYNWSRRRDSDKSVAREKEKAELASLVTRVGEDLRTYVLRNSLEPLFPSDPASSPYLAVELIRDRSFP